METVFVTLPDASGKHTFDEKRRGGGNGGGVNRHFHRNVLYTTFFEVGTWRSFLKGTLLNLSQL